MLPLPSAGDELMWRRAAFLILVLTAFAGAAAAEELVCGVRYLSAEHVYLDAGSGAGLTVGMRARVVRDGRAVAELEVVFTAEHSASCRIISGDGDVQAGDRVVCEVADSTAPEVVVAPVPQRTRTGFKGESPVASHKGPSVSGSIALQWDHTDEFADRSLETNLYSLPFRLKVTRLGNMMEFRARGSIRHILRSGYHATTADQEWRNRIREVALVRDGRELDWHFAVGRVGGRYTASAGPFDGLSFNHRVGGGIRLGAFGGFAPEWGDLGFGTDDHLAGVTFHLNHRAEGGGLLDMVVAGVGRYREGEISREYVTMTTTWNSGRRLSLLQAAEFDINRGWRKEAAGTGLEVSSLALTGRYRFSRGVNVSLGYDDRAPVRTWETKSLPDRLFTEAGRIGWRAGMNLRSPGGLGLNLSGTLRDDERTAETSTSWSARAYAPNWPVRRLSLDASVRGFDGPYLSGWAPMVGATKTTTGGLRLRLEGGYYGYSGSVGDDQRSNSWVKAGAAQDLSAHWTVGADYRHDWGDDIAGRRWFLEMRHRF
ncbi:MAG: hypothetical protein ABFS42_07250 [Candidatus Krumholzibacteriota bacterium]